jgi:transcriptional repressor NrdR
MRCPRCKNNQDQVLDSREVQSGEVVRRRRECLDCGARFTTYERLDLDDLRVVKRDGRREPWSREKMMGGLLRACEKTPVNRDTLEGIVTLVEERIAAAASREMSSEAVGELIMEQLKAINQVAYVRFASVYRRFAEMEDFIDLAKRLQKPPARRRGK